MTSVYVASESEFEEISRFRASIYNAEAGIQEDNYQDVFNDYLSKNVILRDEEGLRGAIRLAFSREAQEFYISYLALRPDARNHCNLRLLLGALFLLMKVNRIQTVRADSADNNLEMYLSSGCRVIGNKFRKYGFTCEWTPLTYTLGTNYEIEERLIENALRHLESNQLEWRFQPRILLCKDINSYYSELERLIATRRIFGLVPHLSAGGRLPPGLKSLWLKPRAVHSPTDTNYNEQNDPSFDYFNRNFNSKNLILITRDSSLMPMAKTYGMLCGKTLTVVEDWSALQLHLLAQADSLFLIIEPHELPEVIQAVARLPRRLSVGIATGASFEAVSSLLLKNYFHFIGPGQPQELAIDSAYGSKSRVKLVALPTDALRDYASLHASQFLSLLEAYQSHTIARSKEVADEAMLLLSCLCQAGYTIGEAVRYVNAVICEAPNRGGELRDKLWLFGDPSLRLYPFRPHKLDVEIEAMNSYSKVLFNNAGHEARLYHFQFRAEHRWSIRKSKESDIYTMGFYDGTTQHLFIFACSALPSSLILLLDLPESYQLA